MYGVITDLHGPKIRDVGADPFRKLGTSYFPILDPMRLLVIKAHACDIVNGSRHNWNIFAQGRSS